MTDADVDDGATTQQNGEGGVLANLPRTRPQRSSARRAAARSGMNGGANGTARSPATPRSADAPRKLASTAQAGRSTGAAQGRTSRQQPSKAIGAQPKRSRPAKTRDSAASAQAKSAAAAPPPAKPRPSNAVRTQRARAAKRPTAPPRPLPPQEPAPRQGYECEGERPDSPVQPPGGPELVASAAEIFSELTKAGLSAGERLLKDVFSRLSSS
jgi:Ca-activated chloride channel family protein